MIALDTNVLVRYLAQDDPRQSAAATRLMEKTLTAENPGFVSLVTLCEVGWVLRECYGADEGRLRTVFEALLGTRQVQVESPERVWKALRAWQGSGADFSDALIGQVALAAGAEKVITFDRGAARLPGFELLA